MFYAQSTSTVISGRETDRDGGDREGIIGARETTILYLGSK